MFGIGIQEMLILLILLGLMVAPVVGVIIVVFAVQRSRRNGIAADLRPCPDCGGTVSVYAPGCPHCGKAFR